MTASELKSTIILALIFASRLLGLFMILPVLALYVDKISGATPTLIGIAAGIYGLTQALCQFPFGVLSDYWGRKSVISFGLILFSLGSLLAAFSHSMTGLILGRAIQGMGAIGSPLLALLADNTREEVRTRAMAFVGISIGLTFSLSFIIGPSLESHFGLSGLFMISALLGIGGLALLWFGVPSAQAVKPPALKIQLGHVFKQKSLWGLYAAIFSLHAILIAIFQILPAKIELLAMSRTQFYLSALVVSLLIVLPMLRHADKVHWQRKLLLGAFLLLALSAFGLAFAVSAPLLLGVTILFFVAFNYLEASLPSVVSKLTAKENRGTALGLFSCAQFLGMFLGGVMGGVLQQWRGPWGVGLGCLLLATIAFWTLKCLTNTDERGAKTWLKV